MKNHAPVPIFPVCKLPVTPIDQSVPGLIRQSFRDFELERKSRARIAGVTTQSRRQVVNSLSGRDESNGLILGRRP
jgi:hypothetical protein